MVPGSKSSMASHSLSVSMASTPKIGGGANVDAIKGGESEAFQLKMEVTELRNRLKILDGGTGRCELLDLLQQRDEEIKAKDHQLLDLGDRFCQIKEGLDDIEKERRDLKRHLVIREKEVGSLVQRCATQEDKIQEGKDLRISYNSLQDQCNELRIKLREHEDNLVRIISLQKELAESRDSLRDERDLVTKLRIEQKETSDGLLSIVDKQKGSLADMEKREAQINLELVQAKEERDNFHKNISKLKQLVANNERTTDELKEKMKQQEDHLNEKLTTMRDQEKTIATLTNAKNEADTLHERRMRDLLDDHAARIHDIETKHSDKVEWIQQTHEGTVSKLKGDLDEKNSDFQRLVKDLEVMKEKLSSLKSQNQSQQLQNERTYTNQQKEIDDLKAINDKLSETLSRAENDLAAVEKDLLSEQRRCESMSKREAQLKADVDALKEENKRLIIKFQEEAAAQRDESSKQKLALEKDHAEQIKERDVNISTLTAKNASLSDKLKDMRTELMEHKEALEKVRGINVKISRRNTSLEEEITTLQSDSEKSRLEMAEEINVLKAQVTECKSFLQMERETARKVTKEREEEKQKMLNDSSKLSDILAAKDAELKSFAKQLTMVRTQCTEHEDDKARLSQTLVESEERGTFLKAELEKTEAARNKMESRNAELASHTEKELAQLRSDLSSALRKSAEAKKEWEETLKSAETANVNQEKQYESILSSNRSTIESLKGSLAKWEDDAVTMQNEISRLREDGESKEAQVRKLEMEVDEVKTTNTNMAKQMKKNTTDANEKICERDALVDDLKEKLNSAELKAAEVVSELEEEITRGMEQCSEIERKSTLIKEQLEGEITKLKGAASHQISETERLKKILQTRDEEVNEKKEALAALEESRALQEKKTRALRAELNLTAKAFETAKVDNEKAVVALELEIDHLRTQNEDNISELQAEITTLQDANRLAKDECLQQSENISRIQTLLNDRTKLLGDMVIQNKDLEGDLQEARAIVTDLQEETDSYMHQKDEAEATMMKIKKRYASLEDDFHAALTKERGIRERVEAELGATRVALENARRDIKDAYDKEKEITVLKDKVKRQEAYLKRKLEKERVLKENPMLIKERTTNIAAEPPKSPTRKPGIPRGRQRSSSRPRRPSSTERGMNDRSFSESLMFPDELGAILGDEV